MQLYPSVRNFERSFILQNKVSHCSIFPPDLSALTLHILAMAFMFCDHLWATLAGDAWWLTGIGRLAFPMFAFFLVEGFFHTHDRKKYCMRLLLLAILSELPINLMYSGLLFYPFHQNVIWTLLTGFLCIWAIDTLRKKCPVWLWIPSILLLSAVGYVLATLLMFDYYGEGVLTVIVFYLFHGKNWWQLAGQFAGLYWINVMLLAGMQIPLQLSVMPSRFQNRDWRCCVCRFCGATMDARARITVRSSLPAMPFIRYTCWYWGFCQS